ncbi:hypothetical protein [Nocardioides sp. CCNWLW239]
MTASSVVKSAGGGPTAHPEINAAVATAVAAIRRATAHIPPSV